MPDILYVIELRGHSNELRLGRWVPGSRARMLPNGNTEVVVPVADQAMLRSVAIRLWDLGMTIIRLEHISSFRPAQSYDGE